MRYFLAIETTRRRLPPESSRLACSYSSKTVSISRTRVGELCRLLEDEPRRPVELLPHDEDVFGVVAVGVLLGLLDLGEILELLVHRLQLPHQRLDPSGAKAALFEQRRDPATALLHLRAERRVGRGAVSCSSCSHPVSLRSISRRTVAEL